MIRRAAFNAMRRSVQPTAGNFVNAQWVGGGGNQISRRTFSTTTQMTPPGTASINTNPVQSRTFASVASADAASLEAMGAERAAKFKRTKSHNCRETLKTMEETNDYGPKHNFNSVLSSRLAKGVTPEQAVELRSDPEQAKKVLGGPVMDHALSMRNGNDGDGILKFVTGLTLSNPYLFLIGLASSYRIYKQYYGDESDPQYSSAAYPFHALAKEKRREGHQSWVEFVMQRPTSVMVDPEERYKTVDGKPNQHFVKKHDNTKVVKTNSYRPGGQEIEKAKVKKEMQMAQSEGVPLHHVMKRTRSNRAGLYDTQGIHDSHRTPEFTKNIRAEAAAELNAGLNAATA